MDYAWLRERMQARYGIEKSDFVLVYIGRFGAEKSIGDLLMLLSWALMEQPHTSSCWSATGRNESISPFLVLQRLHSIVAWEHHPAWSVKCPGQRTPRRAMQVDDSAVCSRQSIKDGLCACSVVEFLFCRQRTSVRN